MPFEVEEAMGMQNVAEICDEGQALAGTGVEFRRSNVGNMAEGATGKAVVIAVPEDGFR
ncbi:hypothetical protein FHX16_005282 [Rhizobium sp. BK661]|nr:hypothetical protein [Rhizobium sp. BK661]